MFMSGHQSSGKCHNLNVATELFENVAQFKFWERQ